MSNFKYACINILFSVIVTAWCDVLNAVRLFFMVTYIEVMYFT